MRAIKMANKDFPEILRSRFARAFVAVISLLLGAGAQAVVLDFEALAIPGHVAFPSGTLQPYVEDGFKFTTGGGQSLSFWGTANQNYIGSIMLFNNTLNPVTSPSETKIETVDGGLFSISGITLAKLAANNGLGVSETFIGTKADNSTVQVTFDVPSGPLATTVTQFIFPGTFVDLKSVSWFQSQAFPDNSVVQIDDVIVAAVVPLPPAIGLLAAAFLTLVARSRSKPSSSEISGTDHVSCQ